MIEFLRDVWDSFKIAHWLYAIASAIAWCASVIGGEPAVRSWFDGDPQPKPVVAPAVPKPDLKPLTIIKTVKVPMTPAEALLSAIHLHDEAPAMLLKSPCCEGEKKKLIGFAPVWCVPCWEVPGKTPRPTSPVGYLRDHPAIEIDWKTDAPKNCPMFPAIYDPETKRYYHGDENGYGDLRSWDTLTAAMEDTRSRKGMLALRPTLPAINIGSIDRAPLFEVMRGLGREGTFIRKDKAYTWEKDWSKFTIPENERIDWQDDTVTRRFVAQPPFTVSYLGAWKQINAVTVTVKRVTLVAVWPPDLEISVKDQQ